MQSIRNGLGGKRLNTYTPNVDNAYFDVDMHCPNIEWVPFLWEAG